MTHRSETVWSGASRDPAGEHAAGDGTGGPLARPDTAVAACPAESRLDRIVWAVTDAALRHWILGLLLPVRLALRAVTQVGYEPALPFIDSKEYIFGTDSNTTYLGATAVAWLARERGRAAAAADTPAAPMGELPVARTGQVS